MAVAIFGAGCFWGVEEMFRTLDGVSSTSVGYMGGKTSNPTYQQVCTGTSEHAEVVQVTYEPALIDYETLVALFFENHNPTQFNRQGPDFGSQYRSVIFYADANQQEIATRMKAELEASGKFYKSVVTAIEAAADYWPAEDYHQQYLLKRGMTSCHI